MFVILANQECPPVFAPIKHQFVSVFDFGTSDLFAKSDAPFSQGFIPVSLIDFFLSILFWIRQIIYKIIFCLQPNIKHFLNIYFLTTIRFFACFLPFVYTLYIHENIHIRT